jgi:hypothetical protein
MPVTSYSRTPASNSSAPPNGAPEGMAPSAVNNTIRQIMTDVVNEAGKGGARVLGSVAGTNTITAGMTPALDAYSAGMVVILTPANTITGAATLNIDTLGAKAILKQNGNPLVAGDLVAGTPAVLVLDAASSSFALLNPLNVGIPQAAHSGSVTLALENANQHIYHASGAGAGDTYTIPANASVAYPVGTTLTFVNSDSNSLAIAITTDTLTLAGTTTTGSRALAQNGIATAIKVTTTSWIISGVGLT